MSPSALFCSLDGTDFFLGALDNTCRRVPKHRTPSPPAATLPSASLPCHHCLFRSSHGVIALTLVQSHISSYLDCCSILPASGLSAPHPKADRQIHRHTDTQTHTHTHTSKSFSACPAFLWGNQGNWGGIRPLLPVKPHLAPPSPRHLPGVPTLSSKLMRMLPPGVLNPFSSMDLLLVCGSL